MTDIKKIPITGPSITDAEVNYVAEAAREGWYQNANKYIKEFQDEFAKYTGSKYAIATSSCHGALHLALLSLGIGKGDEVIVPDITWIASAAAVVYVGAKPVFADINKETWTIDAEQIEKVITPRTKAIMPVTLYGHPPDMDPILALAEKRDLFVIEDAAQAVGSLYKGRHPGSMGHFGVFSFHGTKIMTTGEGGMLVTSDPALYARAESLSNLGRKPEKIFWNVELGYKYKMTNMQAALGTIQLRRIDELVSKKLLIFGWYQRRFKDVSGVVMNVECDWAKNNYWMPTIVWDLSQYGIKKEVVMEKLKEKGIDSRPFFYPLSSMPPMKADVHTPVAYDISPRSINLPCAYSLTEEDANYVADQVIAILEASKK